MDGLRSGIVFGSPGEGNGSGLSCASYQAGSIHSSATQLNVPVAGGCGGAEVRPSSGAVLAGGCATCGSGGSTAAACCRW